MVTRAWTGTSAELPTTTRRSVHALISLASGPTIASDKGDPSARARVVADGAANTTPRPRHHRTLLSGHAHASTRRVRPSSGSGSLRREASRARAMLLCLSSRQRCSPFEEPVQTPGEVALEAAGCFASGLALLDAPFDVGDRGGV
jgi:hypothetical protein